MEKEKLTTQEVLDLINEVYEYRGLSNENKTSTDDRDDLINRSLLNSYKDRFNKQNRKQIEPVKINQKTYLYNREDIDDLLDFFDEDIVRILRRKTIDFNQYISNEVNAFGLEYKPKNKDKYKRIPKSILEPKVDKLSKDEIEAVINENTNKILNSFIDMDKITEDAVQLMIDGQTNYSFEEYLK